MPDEKKNDLKADKELEAEATKMGANPMHPLVSQVTQRLGAFNLVRNKRNERTVEMEKIQDQM